jgi:hypothetical protein
VSEANELHKGLVVWVGYRKGIFNDGKPRPCILLNKFGWQWSVMTLTASFDWIGPREIVVEPSPQNGLQKRSKTGSIAVISPNQITSVIGTIEDDLLARIMEKY